MSHILKSFSVCLAKEEYLCLLVPLYIVIFYPDIMSEATRLQIKYESHTMLFTSDLDKAFTTNYIHIICVVTVQTGHLTTLKLEFSHFLRRSDGGNCSQGVCSCIQVIQLEVVLSLCRCGQLFIGLLTCFNSIGFDDIDDTVHVLREVWTITVSGPQYFGWIGTQWNPLLISAGCVIRIPRIQQINPCFWV